MKDDNNNNSENKIIDSSVPEEVTESGDKGIIKPDEGVGQTPFEAASKAIDEAEAEVSDKGEVSGTLSSASDEAINEADPRQAYVENSAPEIEVPEENSGKFGKFSQVAASASSKTFYIIGFALLLIILGYFAITKLFMGTDTQYVQKTDQQLQSRKDEILKQAKPITTQQEDSDTNKTAPKIPEPLPVQAPKAPEPPQPPVPTAPLAPLFPGGPSQNATVPGSAPNSIFGGVSNSFANQDDEEAKKKLSARRKAGIMVVGGGGGASTDAGGVGADKKDDKDAKDKTKDATDASKKKDNSDYLGFGDGSLGESTLRKTQATQIKATYIGRLDSMIAQGKIINAVLETAINTDLPGTLRGIVSHDVYAESGKAILIPKGSRVVGTYENQIKGGQTRVSVIWNRLIRPDGIDLAIESPGVDPLGRSGLSGFLDDKFLIKLSNAFLVSYIIPIVANKLANAKSNSPVQQTTASNATTNVTSTTTSSDFKTQQLQESSDKFKEIAGKAVEDSFNTKPTIMIDQGYQFNIFVNKDLVFPPEVALGNMKVIK